MASSKEQEAYASLQELVNVMNFGWPTIPMNFVPQGAYPELVKPEPRLDPTGRKVWAIPYSLASQWAQWLTTIVQAAGYPGSFDFNGSPTPQAFASQIQALLNAYDNPPAVQPPTPPMVRPPHNYALPALTYEKPSKWWPYAILAAAMLGLTGVTVHYFRNKKKPARARARRRRPAYA